MTNVINLPTYEQVEEIRGSVEKLEEVVINTTGYEIFKDVGEGVFKVPSGVKKVLVTMFGSGGSGGAGGGGGGGGKAQSTASTSGGGGGSGSNGSHGPFVYRYPIYIGDNVTEIPLKIGNPGYGSTSVGGVGGEGNKNAAGGEGKVGEVGSKGAFSEGTFFGDFIILEGSPSGNGGFGGNGGNPGYTNGGTGGVGGIASINSALTINGEVVSSSDSFSPNFFYNNVVSNGVGGSGGTGRGASETSPLGGSGGVPRGHTNTTVMNRNQVLNILNSISDSIGYDVGFGGLGGVGGDGGLGSTAGGINGGDGKKGEKGQDGKSGLILIEWGI